MYLKIVFASSVYLLSLMANAQTNDITRILHEIEKNNKELQAYSTLMASRQLEFKSRNNLPDPEAGFYYLPWGDHNTGDYTEFQITQSFEFPTIYGARSGLIEKQEEQLALELAAMRQDVLLPAKMYCLQLVHLNKRIRIEQNRVQLAEKVYEQVHVMYEKEQVGILALNNAKIAWLQEQFKVMEIEKDKSNVLLNLQNLNGGIELSFNQADYVDSLNLDALDNIWQHRLMTDPTIIILQQQEDVALQQIKLSKNNSLPNLTAGFNYQGVSGINYSGIYGSVTIPLWSNRNKVKSAKALYEYQQSNTNAKSLTAYADFQKQYNNYQMLVSKFNTYQDTLLGLNSDDLLVQAYELGEISFITYYMELQFYHRAFDTMLETEIQLNQLKAEILKHRL